MGLIVLNSIVLVLLLLFAVYLRSSVGGSPQKTPAEKTLKIYGGERTNVKNYPFIVKLENIRTINGELYMSFCAGTLISPKCVLTAAHCLDDAVAKNWQVVLGANLSVISQVKTMLPSESFTRYPYLDMDVAILVLKHSMRQSKTVQLDYTKLQEGDTVKMIGYSYPGHEREYTDLYQAETKVISITKLRRFQKFSPKQIAGLNENMFYVKEGKGTNKGDSGGPVLRHGQQVGIISGVNLDNASDQHKNPFFVKLSSKHVKTFIENARKKYCQG